MNVLLTSSGRRTYLVEYFKEALHGEGLVFAANSTKSPALLAADGPVITPLIYSAEYIPFLLSFCKENRIGLLVPLFDIDLPVLSAQKKAFEAAGTVLAVSDPETVAACNDKYLMSRKLREAGIMTPESVLSLLEAEKLFSESPSLMVKPRFGMGSIGVEKACSREELTGFYSACRRKIRNSYLKYEAAGCEEEAVILQKEVQGTEYGLDVINDFDGNFVETVVKKKAAMRAGETDEAVTLGPSDPEYARLWELGKKIACTFRHIGNMDVDVILEETSGIPCVIDMNARFGGGYPFTHAAGVNLPLAFVLWAEGKKAPAELFRAKPGVHCYKDIRIASC